MPITSWCPRTWAISIARPEKPAPCLSTAISWSRWRGGHGELTQLLSHDFIHEGIFQLNYIDAMAVVDAEQLLATGGYVESRTMAEDLELVLHLLAENRQLVLLPMLLGYWYSNPRSLGAERGAADNGKIERMYNQRGTGLPLTYQPRMYHPDLGYLV